ncbi:phosphotransferase [Microlunatus sp. Gsoil 973]|uniref:phosphotransferase n=1 Tax=Microlunatus sp. Gsoil 973 TaxID=2672569 RepID=UPI001E4119C1|nr:phosphotransferase [Microlunatus sp. Gsoil 973]
MFDKVVPTRAYSDVDVLEEIPLPNGDVTEGVVRVGDTVRRPVGPHSALVHAVLDHLEAVGFAGAPRFLGIDDQGREVLTFIEGEVAGRPHPSWIADEERLLSLAGLVRALDDAMIDFGFPDIDTETHPDPPGIPPPQQRTFEFIGHRDITPENVVWRDTEAYALIDFDLVRPCSRMLEVQNALMYWAPLSHPRDRDPDQIDLDVPRRCRLFADAYGLSREDRAILIDDLIYGTERSWHLMRDRAERLGGGWARMWDEGVGDQIRRRREWLLVDGPAVTAALLAE